MTGQVRKCLTSIVIDDFNQAEAAIKEDAEVHLRPFPCTYNLFVQE